MERIERFQHYGLFDARVPRYTSYPPANHFETGTGQDNQQSWLRAVPEGSDVSLYIHIPFCKRLCWFCACRTQGTQTLRPVDAYVAVLRAEIRAVRATLSPCIRMARLHLGGGTPTILSPETMTVLLQEIYAAFTPTENFEFSVEIDPTEAGKPLLQTLITYGMNRASIGVQDFAPRVQAAIGRPQTVEQTQDVIAFLRAGGVKSLNLDVLYGLPLQTAQSFAETLQTVVALAPDRLAIYGYAHVPWMSKRQVMIKDSDLPDATARFELAEFAQTTFANAGYEAIGIDHFALPSDGLAQAARDGTLHRNFQGYTDDQSKTLIGLGASAISRFAQGYVQNAHATFAYQDRIINGGFAGHKGYAMSSRDHLIATMVEDLMCRFAYDEPALGLAFPAQRQFIRQTAVSLMRQFPDLFYISNLGLQLYADAYPLVRIIAHYIDGLAPQGTAHSSAI